VSWAEAAEPTRAVSRSTKTRFLNYEKEMHKEYGAIISLQESNMSSGNGKQRFHFIYFPVRNTHSLLKKKFLTGVSAARSGVAK
jgi:hypothetical protein